MNPDRAEREIQLTISAGTAMVIHGNMCLALRHPENNGLSRQYAVDVVKVLGRLIVETGLLTEEEMRMAEKIEQQYSPGANGGEDGITPGN